MRLLVCGGRDFADYALLKSALNRYEDPVELAHGGASGADDMAGAYAIDRGWPVRVFKADWAKHGKAAGPIRNQQMLDEFKPDIVIAFPGGRGTGDMLRRAAKVPGMLIVEYAREAR